MAKKKADTLFDPTQFHEENNIELNIPVYEVPEGGGKKKGSSRKSSRKKSSAKKQSAPAAAQTEQSAHGEAVPIEQTAEPAALNNVTVKIAGRNYNLCGEESVEYLARLGEMVDQKMSALLAAHPMYDTKKLSVLAALQIAEDYLTLEAELAELKAQTAGEQTAEDATADSSAPSHEQEQA